MSPPSLPWLKPTQTQQYHFLSYHLCSTRHPPLRSPDGSFLIPGFYSMFQIKHTDIKRLSWTRIWERTCGTCLLALAHLIWEIVYIYPCIWKFHFSLQLSTVPFCVYHFFFFKKVIHLLTKYTGWLIFWLFVTRTAMNTDGPGSL